MGNRQSKERPARYPGYEQRPAPAPTSQKISCGIASRPADRLLRPMGRYTPGKLTHQAFWYQTPDGYNHYIGLGKEPNGRPVYQREPGWRRETAHKNDPNQFGFVIQSNKDLMPLHSAMDPSGMDQLVEIALRRHGKYELTANNCQDFARVLLDEFAFERKGRANVFHADDRRLQNGAVDYNTAGLRAAYGRGYANQARAFRDPYPHNVQRRAAAAVRAEPNGSGIYVERDVEVLVSGGRIGYPVQRPIQYSHPERQTRKLENPAPVQKQNQNQNPRRH